MKRLWRHAETQESAAGFSILLDGKPLQATGGPLTMKFRALADAIADEWSTAGALDGTFHPADLLLTRLAGTAETLATSGRDELIGQLTAYGINDLLCYRAAEPAALAELQTANWDPWLTWLDQKFAVSLIITADLTPVQQPPDSKRKLRDILAMHSNHKLAALAAIVPALGSLVLGLALARQVLDAATAMQTAFLDEQYQEQRWGADPASALRREKIAAEIAAAARFMVLCTP